MKKILTALLAVAMLLGCVAMFASCTKQGPKPNLDLEDAADILEDEDYYVVYEDDIDTVSIKEMLYATNDDDSITIVLCEDTNTAKLAYEEKKLTYEYEIESLKLEIKSAEHMLKKYEDDLDSDEIDEYEDMIKDLEKELEEKEDDYCFGRSGKYVWYGTRDAVKDSKG